MSDQLNDIKSVMENILLKNTLKLKGPINSAEINNYFIAVYKVTVLYTNIALMESKFRETGTWTNADQENLFTFIIEMSKAVREANKHLDDILSRSKND